MQAAGLTLRPLPWQTQIERLIVPLFPPKVGTQAPS